MGCGICEHNATYCECTHHEQAAYEKGRSKSLVEIARLQAVLSESNFEKDNNRAKLEVAKSQRDTAWNDAIEAAAHEIAHKINFHVSGADKVFSKVDRLTHLEKANALKDGLSAIRALKRT